MRTMLVFLTALLVGALSPGCLDGPAGPPPDSTFITAGKRLADVSALARTQNGSLRLMSITCNDVTSDGTAEVWRYLFADTEMPGTTYWFHATAFDVFFDSTAPLMAGPAVISHIWFDSDAALHEAEQMGGSEFRRANAQATIEASLGEACVPNSRPFWWITYRSPGSSPLSLDVDAGKWRVVH